METELLLARIRDTAEICLKTSRPKFLGFLSSAEAVLAEQTLKTFAVDFSLFGGYESAERVMLGCFPEWDTDKGYPIAAVTFKFRNGAELTHRDFLGSLMALGIKRETVGDILIEEGRAVAFVSEEIRGYIKTQVTKIGREGVAVEEGYSLPLPVSDTLTPFSDTAASERLDCIIAALCGFSRGKASEVLNLGLVTVNSVVTTKPTKTVSAGDIISVRGKGRFVIDTLDGRTKKNRIIINYRKYI